MLTGPDVSSTSQPDKLSGDTRASIDFNAVDAAVLVAFCLFGLMTYLGRWKGLTPFVFLSSDAGIVASFVAAYEHPDLFPGDVLLGTFSNFRYYLAFHPILIYALEKLVGDYGTAYVALLNFTVVLQATGFYLLGRVLFEDRYWAVLLTIMSLCPVALPVREFWGIYDDPLPRSLFHATLPYLLTAAYRFRADHRVWPWLMVGAGLAFYAHPVSGPPWGFAIWLGMWAFLPQGWSSWKKLAYMMVLGFIFVATLLPFAWNLSQTHQQAIGNHVRYFDVVPIIANRVGKELLDVGTALDIWKEYLVSWPMAAFLGWAFFGSAVVSRLSRGFRNRLMLLAIWAAGILIVSVGITFVEQTICRAYTLPRLQMDSIRGIKYLLPLVLILCLWPLAEIGRTFAGSATQKAAAATLGALLVLVWSFEHPPTFFLSTARAWISGESMPRPTPTERAVMEAVSAVAQYTPPRSVILPVVLPLEIRYAAMRPVAYAYKDGGIFADTNYGALPGWDQATRELEQIAEDKSDPAGQLKRLLNLSERLGAEYVLADLHVDPAAASSLGAKVVWSNELMTLIQCRPKANFSNAAGP